MEKTERLTWIELLRILLMVMVLILHINLCGGILYNVPFSGVRYFSAWLLESLCYGAVNGYAMITGYVCCESKFRYCRIMPTWLQVFFWNTLIILCFSIFGINNAEPVSFFPVSGNVYWYFTSYFGMYFFIPFFNLLIQHLDMKKFTVLTLTLFILFSFFSFTFGNNNDPFNLSNGYSMVWLSTLYFFGAYIKRFGSELKLKKKLWAVIFFISSAIPTISSYLLDIVCADSFGDMIGKYNLGGYTVSYTSPFCVISALALIMLFKDVEIKNPKLVSVINFFAAASFGVYLIHTHPLVFDRIIQDLFVPFASLSTPLLILSIIGAALAAYIALALLEQLRILLFRLLKVRELTFAAADKISGKIHSMRLK